MPGDEGQMPVVCIVCDHAFGLAEAGGIRRLEGFEDTGLCEACLRQEREGWVTLGDLCGEEGEG